MKLTIFFIALWLGSYSCSNNQQNPSKPVAQMSKRDRIVNYEKKAMDFLSQKKYESFIDTAKWYLYNAYYDSKADSLIKNESSYSNVAGNCIDCYVSRFKIGITDAYLDTINNSLHLSIAFFINDSTLLLGNLGNGQGNIPDGIQIDTKNNKVLNFTSGAFHFKKIPENGDWAKPFTPSVKKFVESYKNNIHPDFANLLRKMKAVAW